MTKESILGFSISDLELLMQKYGEKPYRARQIFKWTHNLGCSDFSKMSDLSLPLRNSLQEKFIFTSFSIQSEIKSTDGTIRWVLKLTCGNSIETVFIPADNRGTLCVSSQAGCAVNCGFCQTAVGGFNRNLQVSEIIGQLYFAKNRLKYLGTKISKITNVVMMGMGEPLLNFDNVLPATNIMLHDDAYGLSKYRVTVSTVGILPRLLELSRKSQVSLTISLHATTNALRSKLIPINKKYPLEDLMKVCRNYFPEGSKRKITFAYLMLDGINDSIEDAKRLVKLINNVPAKINLIPFNFFQGAIYQSSPRARIIEFRNFLLNKNIPTTIRETRGDDVSAACGQLVGDIVKKGTNLRTPRFMND
ncbi:MAG: 23S rRNA (adenine(2503)-C(2))-methyltransferase RlmN [Legionellales bacterium]|nr:23S rRNA (adenine(2503)-C(2))-methyltransferase RlmN [Legionellales bacterium]